MIDSNLKNYVPRPFVKTMIGLIVVEQLANALGTAMLGLAAKNLSSPQYLALFLLAFFMVIQIPGVALIFIRKTEAYGYLDTYQNFLEKRLFNLGGHTSIWSSRAQSPKFLAAIGSEADNHLATTAYTQFDFSTYFLNIAANSTALALVLDGNFAWIFAASLLLSFVLYRSRESRLQALVENEQNQRLALSAYVLSSWDNVLLNNQPILKSYRQQLMSQFTKTKSLAGTAATSAATMVFWLGLVSSVPVFLLNAVLAYQNSGDTAFIAGLMITLPRQLNVLNTFRALFQQLTNYKVFSARLKTVIVNSEVAAANLPELIDVTKIRLNGSAVDGLDDLVNSISSRATGRLLISGVNGAGKSSLLLLLNERLPDSLYLPSSPNLEIGEVSPVSTGQNLRRHLDYLFAQSSPVVLLDEWDANLDGDNRSQISSFIDVAARTRLVVEVRHRTEQIVI
jgi:ABC-type bacteriocin/lantibiotic exporter with double-glycine peptidase domain